MKKFVISFLVVGLFTFLGFILMQPDPYSDKAPTLGNTAVQSPDTTTPSGFPYPVLFNFNYSSVPGMNAGTVGAMFFNGKYYFNRWNGTTVYRYNNNGPGGGPGTLADSLTYAGSMRDLTTDGVFIYGGNGTTSIVRFDPNTMATLKTFTLAGGATRAIAWDPNRKGFWNTGFSGNIFFHDTNGVLKTQIASTFLGKYGLAFDSTSSPDSAFIWVWDQTTTSTAGLYKYHIGSGTLKASYIFNLPAVSVGIAGGAEIIANAVPGKLVLLLNYQNFALVGYNLKNLSANLSWTEQTSGISTGLTSVSAVNDNIMWASGASGKVVKTTNKGVNYSVYTLPTTDEGYNIFAWDANTALVTTSPAAGTYIYRTSNGGTNWTQVFFLAGAFGDALWMTDANTAYFMGDPIGGNWLLKKSTNGGVNWIDWATVPTTITGGWNNSFFMLGSNIWFGTNTTTIMYSSNMGANWSTQTTPSANQYAIWFNDASNGLALYTSLYKTTNGGVNWSTLTSPVVTAGAGIAGTGTNWWVTTQDATPAVFFSSNNGANWTTQYTAPTTGGVFRHLTKARTGNTLWGVRSLGGISRYGETIVGVTPIGTVTPTSYSLSQNYPNPFNPTTKINFSIPKSGMVSLKVYDILGKEVSTLVNQNISAGTYTYEFDASRLSSGIYFYRLNVNGFNEVKKMSLIK